MVAVGRALMGRPRLLMMDEPSIGLAPRIVEQIGEIVRSLAADDGMGVLLVEQNAHLAFGLASYVYVLELGEIRVGGPVEEVAASDRVREAYLSA
jgi:branched-chain amino acid transport system ATP-binding protein